MTTIICATNRNEARSRVVFNKVKELFDELNTTERNNEIDLKEVDFSLHSHQYEANEQSAALTKVQDELMIPSERLVFVIPEYNGSFAGIAKVFIDALSIRKNKETFKGKKILLFGCAQGRAGNLRGLDHLSAIFMHMGAFVFPRRLPISKVDQFIKNGELDDEDTIKALKSTIKDFLLF